LSLASLYDLPDIYDRALPPGPCEAFYRGLAEAADGPVLELGCGTGRLTIPLARAGVEITGLDSSPSMLATARRKAEAAGVRVRWRQGDMARLEGDERYALVVLSCNSLAHMTDAASLSACLAGVRRSLAPGGLFAFDVVNPDRRQLERPPAARFRRGHSGEGLRVRETAIYDPETQVRALTWEVRDDDGPTRRLQPLRLRQFFPDELPRLLENAGLRLMSRHGDFDGARFGARSRNQVCVAGRADDADRRSPVQ
jgi:SAM-dependent methyltransferase